MAMVGGLVNYCTEQAEFVTVFDSLEVRTFSYDEVCTVSFTTEKEAELAVESS